MSIDRSLRSKSSLERHRNVLTRAERVQSLMAQERFTEETGVLRLPKVAHRKPKAAKKKAAKVEGAEAAAAAAPAAEEKEKK